MKCFSTIELEQFLKGRLSARELVAIGKHVCSCARCKDALAALPARVAAAAELGSAVLGVRDCPEYEEFSAFVDGALDTDIAKSTAAHVNSCELCARDIEALREMRSHAALRDRIQVTPGQSRTASRGALVHWKRALAGVSLAAVVALAFAFGYMGRSPSPVKDVAVKPPAVNQNSHTQESTPKPPPRVVVQTPPTPTVEVPRPEVVLKDGRYQVIKKNGKLVLARADGSAVGTAAVDEKLTTGKIALIPIPTVAMALLRGGGNYVPPASAPKPVSPSDKIVLSQNPTLSWSPVRLAESYHVRVFDDEGELLVDETAATNSLKVPSPLPRGKAYKWRAGSRFSIGGRWAESAAATFYVLSDEDYGSIEHVKRALPGSHLALGAAYERCGLYDEAAGEYRALRRQNPNSALARKLLKVQGKYNLP